MVTVGILLRLEAKPGKESEVAAFLKSALPLIQAEQGTTATHFPELDGRSGANCE